MNKLPHLYAEAVRILKKTESVEDLEKILSIVQKESNSLIQKKLSDILSNVHRLKNKLKTVIEESKLDEEEPNFCPHLARVLTSVLVLYGPPTGIHESIKTFNKYQEKMLESAVKLNMRVTKNYLPALYVKVDTTKKGMEFVDSKLKKQGYELQEYDDSSSYASFLELVENLELPNYLVDYHLKDMLIFPAGVEVKGSQLHQDKIISPTEKETYIRGLLSGVCENSKAIHISENESYMTMMDVVKKMKNTGEVIVFERREKKREKYQSLLENDKVSSVTCSEQDFLEIEPSQYQHIEYVLLTPGSSRSGIRPAEVNQNMVKGQISSLNLALSLPNVKEVLYSTNSILKEENEEVVKQALLKYEDDFTLADLSSEIGDWKNFGLSTYDFGSQCLRLDPSTDFCTGAFFAKFVRNNKENSTPNRKRKANNKQTPSPKKIKNSETPAKPTPKKMKKGETPKKMNGETPAKQTPAKQTPKKVNGETPAKQKINKSNKANSSVKKNKKVSQEA